MGAVDLEDTCAVHHFLSFGSVYEGAQHVNVAVEHVVLRVLVSTVDAFLGKENGNFRTGHTRHITVEVYGTAYLFFDLIAGLAAGTNLLAGDGHTAHAFGSAFQETVNVALPGGADDHQVIGAMPGGHAHAADVIFKAARGNLGGDNATRLWVNVIKVFRSRKTDAIFERF